MAIVQQLVSFFRFAIRVEDPIWTILDVVIQGGGVGPFQVHFAIKIVVIIVAADHFIQKALVLLLFALICIILKVLFRCGSSCTLLFLILIEIRQKQFHHFQPFKAVVFFALTAFIKLASFYNKFIHLQLFCGTAQYLLLHWCLSDDAKDSDILPLTYSVGSILRLQVHHGIPVTIKYDDRIRSRQVQSQSTRASRQQKNEVGRIWSIKHVHALLPLVCRRGPVEAQTRKTPERKIIFKYRHHLGHLREHENTMPRRLQLGKHSIQQLHLP
mmetsp:Transcript_11726/g.21154  ORF Transcript_11726/g.21154 Transcript_11726/m.21154 type:complete len:271 (+) Transcript_11726:1092-1904(+)